MNRIMVVEDSEEYQKIIGRTLSNYHLTFVTSAEDAEIKIKNENFDCVLIDINLPKKDGFSLLTEVFEDERFDKIPVLCLSGRKEITDKVTAFALGADDYLTKPFDPIELRARIESKIKKSTKLKGAAQIIQVGNIVIDQSRHRVALRKDSGEVDIAVTQTEFKILTCLARRPEQLFTREQLLIAAWGEDSKVQDRVVDVHVCIVRKKLGKTCSHTVKAQSGVGYKLTLTRKP